MNRLYAAPLQGITGYVWRNAHRTVFGGADAYFSPFYSPDINLIIPDKEFRELTQDEADLIPQILTNRADLFVRTAEQLHDMGFSEVNLNLGCPSGTVVAKHKGSGMLGDVQELDCFLGEIFASLENMRVSVKTRVGLEDVTNWPALIEVFNQYPISELIVHPRLRKQFYSGTADRALFLNTMEQVKPQVIYNGDIVSPTDPALHYDCGIMIGRGLISDPALLRECRGGSRASRDELICFHDMLLQGYRENMPGEIPVLHRMRELWTYLCNSFQDTDKPIKQMRKAKSLSDFCSASNTILHNCPLTYEE